MKRFSKAELRSIEIAVRTSQLVGTNKDSAENYREADEVKPKKVSHRKRVKIAYKARIASSSYSVLGMKELSESYKERELKALREALTREDREHLISLNVEACRNANTPQAKHNRAQLEKARQKMSSISIGDTIEINIFNDVVKVVITAENIDLYREYKG